MSITIVKIGKHATGKTKHTKQKNISQFIENFIQVYFSRGKCSQIMVQLRSLKNFDVELAKYEKKKKKKNDLTLLLSETATRDVR